MSDRKFEFGDRVRHARRPEWGIGSIVKAEDTRINGEYAQRLSVRFPNAGLKTLSTLHAELQLVTEEPVTGNGVGDEHPLGGWDRVEDGDWLGEVARRKVEEAMVLIAEAVRDPFNSLRHRLSACLDLYRFERTGRGLVDWAVAQSGLDDPLSRFTRHELEQLFDQWCTQREVHLRRLVDEARGDPATLRELEGDAPPAAREAVRRYTAQR
jgi:hypothetical protein